MEMGAVRLVATLNLVHSNFLSESQSYDGALLQSPFLI